MDQLQLQTFIRRKVIQRETSFLAADLRRYRESMQEAVRGKTALVIGGAGTIGKAFILELLRFQPGKLVVVDWNENGLAELTRDLRSRPDLFLPRSLTTYPFDFGGPVFQRFLRQNPPFDLVAHFAAHKHVRTEKDPYAIEAMLRNNVFATLALLEVLAEKPPAYFFSVSTDKATSPVNVMGASKRLMEEAVLTFSLRFQATTARFANVAFSNGSLPDSFLQRLRRRQPLVAPRDIHRYFVAPEEAGELCLLTALTARSGEIVFPRLERTALRSFSSMALDLLAFLGKEPVLCETEEEARAVAAAWRPGMPYPVFLFDTDSTGEKEEEAFFAPGEPVDLDRYRRLGIIRRPPAFSPEDWPRLQSELESLLGRPGSHKSQIIKLLGEYLPDFQHRETGKNLDDRM